MQFARLAVLVAALLTAVSCQEMAARPDAVARCEGADANCGFAPPIVGGGGRKDAGVVDGGPNTSGEVAGSIVVLADDFLTPVEPYGASARVVAEGALGAYAMSTYNGRVDFRLSGVLSAPLTWFGAEPHDIGLGPMPTLLALDTEASSRADLGLIQADSLDLIFGVISAPTTRLDGHGQVVVFFVRNDSARRPVANITTSIDGAETVIYDTGTGWSDISAGTGPAGAAVLVNIPATTFPGTKHNLLWAGAAVGFQEVLVAANSVTLIQFGLEI